MGMMLAAEPAEPDIMDRCVCVAVVVVVGFLGL